jgi:hypothetical protein
MGAALSLYLALKQLGKNPGIACPSETLVANASLVGIDKVKNELSGDGGDLIVSFPYREGEIEKVSYTLENGYLNIVVKATEDGLSFEQQDVLFKRSGGIPSLLFIVGTPRLSDLGTLFDAEALKNTAIINIDNQNDNQGFGDVVLVTPQASSISELVGSLLEALEVNIDQDIAQNLLSGISQATNNFQNANTSYMAFAMAGDLLKKGARRPRLEARQSDNKSPFGPFTMPQPRQQTQNRDQQSRQQQQQQPREQRQQRPWEQRPQPQPKQQTVPTQPVVTSQPQQQPAAQPVQQPAPMQQPPIQQVERKEEDQETPPDWLAPKVYKSSTLL